MQESRFLKIIIALLLLINIGTLGYLWTDRESSAHRHPFPPGGRPEGGEHTGEYLRRTLQLSADQEQAYRKMREQHHETVMDIRKQMRDQKRRLYSLMRGAATIDTRPEGAAIIDSIAAEQRNIELVTYEHFRELRSICTPAQQTKFDEVISDALERMH